ncbi:microtubule-actin cross-linking factor 1, isoforms 6/7-like [Dunckerocampus dactyliophorus]|uniref:microtubule-actin cross-linking factor 1, isoforms 6/7-like n=1 Tax=Dunckerocampus dactyliophorus TaxID=161453 RepID=UPI002404F2CF|nr:microtubule-actin cross-linking factor 1, isoforms 6/7-like [Dunckerocampus dactyliophorus]
MGCSSSSAQNVDQEKRPGTKPEGSNGDTVAVRNGIIAGTIDDQTQLPVCALADDLQLHADDRVKAVLVVMEAQEDLGSGEDLLAHSEPQPEPVNFEEPGLVAVEEEEASADSASAGFIVEGVVNEEHLMVEPLCEASGEILAMQDVDAVQAVEDDEEMKVGVDADTAKTEVSELESVEVMKYEVPSAEEMKVEGETVGVVEPVEAEIPAVVEKTVPTGAFPEDTNPAVEPVGAVPQEAVAEVPADMPLSFESPMDSSPQLPTSEIPVGTPAPHEVAPNETIPSEESTVESSAPTEGVEAVIDPGIAVATIPEMPLSFQVTDDMQAEQQPGTEEDNKALMMPSETSCPTKVTFAQESASIAENTDLKVPVSSPLLSEAQPTSGTAPCSVESDGGVQVPAAEPIQTDTEATLTPVAAGQVYEPLSEGRGHSSK